MPAAVLCCAAGICRLRLPGRQMTALGMPAPADSTADGLDISPSRCRRTQSWKMSVMSGNFIRQPSVAVRRRVTAL